MVKKIKPVIYSVPIQVFTVPGVGHDWKTWEKLWKQVLDHIEAKISLLKALELDADNLDYLYALADYYLKRGKLQKAKIIAEQMVAKHPGQRIGHDFLEFINKNMP